MPLYHSHMYSIAEMFLNKCSKTKTCMYCFLTIPDFNICNGDLLYSLQAHLKYRCPTCAVKLQSQAHLRKHLERHEGIYDHTCPVCGKGFIKASDVQGHMTVHTGVKDWRCPICNKEYAYKQTLVYHLRRNHKDHAVSSDKNPEKFKIDHF